MKSDFKNVFTNVLAGVVVALTTVQQYLVMATNTETGSVAWENLDWKTIVFNVLLALTLWMTGKDKDGKAKQYTEEGKRLLMLMVIPMFLFVGCGRGNIIITTSSDVEPDSLGIEVTSQIVDAVFNSVEKMSADTLTFTDGVGLAIEIVPQLISSIREYQTAIAEVMDLSDDEILALVSIGDNYDLGSNAVKIKQVFKVSLFAVQTYFVFYNSKGVTGEAFIDEYKLNMEIMLDGELDNEGIGFSEGRDGGFGSVGVGAQEGSAYGACCGSEFNLQELYGCL